MCGIELPLSIFAAFFIYSAAGGVLVMNVKDLSWYIVISTGITSPDLSAVLALYSLTKSIIAIPCGPNAVPTGGAGDALPPSICNFTNADISLAIYILIYSFST